MDRIFLSIHSNHDASAALMINGEIVAAAIEERFTRKRKDAGFPKHSIDFCLAQAGIKGYEIKKAAYTMIDEDPFMVRSKITTNFTLRDYHKYYGENYVIKKLKGEKDFEYRKWLRDEERFNKDELYYNYSFLTDDVITDQEKITNLFRDERKLFLSEYLGIQQEKVVFLDHHYCHAYYAYFSSPFRGEDCIILILDGWGDGRNQSVWIAQNDIIKHHISSNQNDIGRIFKLTTLLLGMRPDEHEYKVMGLAPYAKEENLIPCFEKIKEISHVDGMKIVEKNRPKDLYKYLKDIYVDERFDNIAGAVQKYSEMLTTKLVENIVNKTGIGRLVMAGGIAMNVKINKAISELECVKEMFIPGSGSDESNCVGGCYALNKEFGDNKPLKNLYLGLNVARELDRFNWKDIEKKYIVKKNVSFEEVAKLLRNGDIVARIASRAEFGARALGNRSILADASKTDTVRKINEAVKKRDFWMPFALSLLEEFAHQYIKNPKNIKAKFMSVAFDTVEVNYSSIAAGTHPYDKTVRPQLVSKEDGEYYDLIYAYYKLSGIPALLNTSFNIHGQPIVNNINDALRTFENSRIDHLLINKNLISKIR